MPGKHAVIALLCLTLLGAAPAPATPALTGTLADGATYTIEVPASWNGTLLLYSHGYVTPGEANPARDAGDLRTAAYLLAHRFALAGSSYASTGYAVADGLRDQIDVLDVFAKRVGKPKHTIAWGHSMGGIITAGLVQVHPERFDGALPMCGVLAGTTAGWNGLAVAEHAFKTLLAPHDPLKEARLSDPLANVALATQRANEATATPAGRARLALIAALDGIPAWYPPSVSEPTETAAKTDALIAWLRHVFVPFAFGYRAELERRAGGNLSSTTGFSYSTAFDTLAERELIAKLYRAADLDLRADLRALDAAPPLTADLPAMMYAVRNIDLNGRITIPVLTVHTVADGLVPVNEEAAYASAVAVAGKSALLRQLFVKRAGHCAFTSAETIAALHLIERRVLTGRWDDEPLATLNDRASLYGDEYNSSPPAFVPFTPLPMVGG